MTQRQQELMLILMEECAEVAQRASKAIRFGINEIQPGQHLDNAYRLGLEIGDLMEVIDQLLLENLLGGDAIVEGKKNKTLQLRKYMITNGWQEQEVAYSCNKCRKTIMLRPSIAVYVDHKPVCDECGKG